MDNYFNNKPLSANKQLQNDQAKQALEKNYLEYAQAIVNHLSEEPSLIEPLLEDLDMPIEEFDNRLSGSIKSNITFFDQSLNTILEYKKKRR